MRHQLDWNKVRWTGHAVEDTVVCRLVLMAAGFLLVSVLGTSHEPW